MGMEAPALCGRIALNEALMLEVGGAHDSVAPSRRAGMPERRAAWFVIVLIMRRTWEDMTAYRKSTRVDGREWK